MAKAGNYTNSALQGWSGKGSRTYIMGNELKSGGEGSIYEIKGNDGIVAKLYSDAKFTGTPEIRRYIPDVRDFLEHKIMTMLQYPPRHTSAPNGAVCLAWPLDMLYENGHFRGYIMPKIVNSKNLIAWRNRKEQQQLAPGFNFQYYVAIAMNLSATVAQLHAEADWFAQKYGLSDDIRNQVFALGDFNDNNIMVSYDASSTSRNLLTVALVDMDSINVYNPQERKMYKCCVAAPGFAAPELMGGGVFADPRVRFTHQSDLFDLALHIFQLLMDNVGAFNGMPINNMGGSSINQPHDIRVATGAFPYNSDGSVKASMKVPTGTVDYGLLSPSIRALFARVFTYSEATAVTASVINNRPTAAEWSKVLTDFYQDGFLKCNQNPLHVFPKGYQKGCPWCDAERRLNRPISTSSGVVQIPPQPVPTPHPELTPTPSQTFTPTPSQTQTPPTPAPPSTPQVPSQPNRSPAPLYVTFILATLISFLVMNGNDPLTGGWLIFSLVISCFFSACLAYVLSKKYICSPKPWVYYLGLILCPLVAVLSVIGAALLAVAAIIALFVLIATSFS